MPDFKTTRVPRSSWGNCHLLIIFWHPISNYSKSLTFGGVTGKNRGQRIPNETDHLLTPHSIHCSSCLILKQRAYLAAHEGTVIFWHPISNYSKSLTSGGVTGKNRGQIILNQTDHLLTPHSIYSTSCLILKQRAYLEAHEGTVIFWHPISNYSKSLTFGGVIGKNRGQRKPNETDHLLTPHSIYSTSCLILNPNLDSTSWAKNHEKNIPCGGNILGARQKKRPKTLTVM